MLRSFVGSLPILRWWLWVKPGWIITISQKRKISSSDRCILGRVPLLGQVVEEAQLGRARKNRPGVGRRDEAVTEAQDDRCRGRLEQDAVGRDEDRVVGSAALGLAQRRHVDGVRQRLRAEQQPRGAGRRLAVEAAVERLRFSGFSHKARAMSVRISPGAMQLTRTPRGPNSTEKLRATCMSAALEMP